MTETVSTCRMDLEGHVLKDLKEISPDNSSNGAEKLLADATKIGVKLIKATAQHPDAIASIVVNKFNPNGEEDSEVYGEELERLPILNTNDGYLMMEHDDDFRLLITKTEHNFLIKQGATLLLGIVVFFYFVYLIVSAFKGIPGAAEQLKEMALIALGVITAIAKDKI